MDDIQGFESFMHAPWPAKWIYEIPMFLCEWDSRARDQHWSKKDWPARKTLQPGEKNIL